MTQPEYVPLNIPASEFDRQVALLKQRLDNGVKTFAAVVFGSLLALLLAHYPMIFSGLRLMQQDEGDTRFNNYLLEHSYQWVRLSPQHPVLWDPPIFSPQTNVLAYSDAMLSFAPVYWCWRIAGFAPDTAFEFWMLTTCVINYVLAFVFLRQCLNVSRPARLIGGILFAAGSSRITQLTHEQLYSQAYLLIALIALGRMFVNQAGSRPLRTGVWIGTFGLAVAFQFWGGFYNGYFLVLACAIALLWALLMPSYRRAMGQIIWQNRVAIALTALVVLLVLLPLGIQYLAAMRLLGARSFDEVRIYLPRPQSWVYLGPWNWMYGWMNHLPMFTKLASPFEQALGLGFATTIAAAIGLWTARRKPLVVLVVLTMLTLIVASTLFAEKYTLWQFVYWCVPGARAVRAIARIGILLLLPASMGVALFLDLWRGKLRWLGAGIAILCLTEQFSFALSYDKFAVRDRINSIVARIPPHRSRFFYMMTQDFGRPEAQIDAMWASMQSGVPTINGYTGNMPPNYDLYDIVAITAEQRHVLRSELADWLNQWGLDDRDVAIIGDPDSEPGLSSAQVTPPAGDCPSLNYNLPVVMKDPAAEAYLHRGWSGPEEYRWTEGRIAEIYFQLPRITPAVFRFHAVPFLAEGKLPAQHVGVELNGVPLQSFVLSDGQERTYSLTLPLYALRDQNDIRFTIPEANSLDKLGGGHDARMLGIALKWFEVDEDKDMSEH